MQYDSVTGQYYDQARDYDPASGDFSSLDPLSFGGGQINLYVYVNDNPLNAVDPAGTGDPGQSQGEPPAPPQPTKPKTTSQPGAPTEKSQAPGTSSGFTAPIPKATAPPSTHSLSRAEKIASVAPYSVSRDGGIARATQAARDAWNELIQEYLGKYTAAAKAARDARIALIDLGIARTDQQIKAAQAAIQKNSAKVDQLIKEMEELWAQYPKNLRAGVNASTNKPRSSQVVPKPPGIG